jgi:tRNA threonylcarbamoyladenosine biosynthesis protein TsaB
MLILTLRTDNVEAEVGLYDDLKRLSYEKWQAHRELSVTLHKKIEELLTAEKKSWQDIQGITVFKGPGSFTGLRIGLTIANTLSYGLRVPVVSSIGDNWLVDGVVRLINGENEKMSMPEYGVPPNISTPRR